ncbi:hypothetical protein BJ508DRAFT_322345 [Ascobolus immersus RN42]|uniref:Uncharacterized protein n=1 Tax=Ascobolus immersus RN42 TaxID=1160509 RepID=A0A3N4IHW5_ASCIM|nr:hypothetical protein BJ508DRAFT_322345 [Ascobolus immersus RN42]
MDTSYRPYGGDHIARMLLDVLASLSFHLNKHFGHQVAMGKPITPEAIKAVIYSQYSESSIVTNPPVVFHDFSSSYITRYRELRESTPVTNLLLDWLEQEFKEEFRCEWLAVLREVGEHCNGGLGFVTMETVCMPCPKVEEWGCVCDAVAGLWMELATREDLLVEERQRVQWACISRQISGDLKDMLRMLSPYINHEEGLKYVDRLQQTVRR